MTDFEDDPPCIHHRSQFDTERCPAPDDVHVLTEPVKLTQRGRQTLAEAGIDLPVVLQFDGGDVPLPKPTRAELILSAKQWATAIREHLIDWNAHTDAAKGMCDRLDAVLAELAAMEASW